MFIVNKVMLFLVTTMYFLVTMGFEFDLNEDSSESKKNDDKTFERT